LASTNNLVKRPSISTKGITHETTQPPAPKDQPPSHPADEVNLASTFGTLLSSQGTDAHPQTHRFRSRLIRGNRSSLGLPGFPGQILITGSRPGPFGPSTRSASGPVDDRAGASREAPGDPTARIVPRARCLNGCASRPVPWRPHRWDRPPLGVRSSRPGGDEDFKKPTHRPSNRPSSSS
jgi:hypothetical protein